VVAVVALVVLAVLLILHYAGGHDDGDGDGDQGRADHTPTLAGDGQSQARLDITGGVTRLTVTTDDLGGDLVHAETPDGQRAVPILREPSSGSVTVATEAKDASGDGDIDLTVRLARDVRWDIAVDGGSSLLTLDLDSARLKSLDITQGVATINADLPKPDGVLNARIAGGASAVRVTLPTDVPARATFSGGAGGATIDGVHHGGLAGGAVLTADGQLPDRLELALDSGIGSLELTHRG
jgi:hypothetical protein